jgi:hypothetical protein
MLLKVYLHAAEGVLRYLKGTTDYTLHYPRTSTSNSSLWNSVDSDWGSCGDIEKDTPASHYISHIPY